MNHRHLVASVALVLLAVGCGGDGDTVAELEQRIEELESQSTTEATTTTLATTTTTTVATTTTTEAATKPTSSYSVPSYLTDPSESDLTVYLLMATTLLNETPWSLDEMGDDWAIMLREGSVATCKALFEGDSTPEAIYAGLQETPLAGVPPEDLESQDGSFQASSLALLFLSSGTGTYCPDLRPPVFDADSSQAAAAFVDAWEELTGG